MKHLSLGIILLILLHLPVGASGACLYIHPQEAAHSDKTTSLQDSLSALIPSTFSPNADGINDTWTIPGITDDANNEVWIYNRWGTLVFHQAPYNNQWIGRSNESGMGTKDLPEGTYFFVLRWKNLLHKGSVYLKK